MKKTALFLTLLLAAIAVFAAGKKTVPEKPVNPSGAKLKYVEWDAHMLGVDTPEKVAALKSSVKRVPVIGLVGFSGINTKVLKKNVEYACGPKQHRNMHDTYQISEVMQIARKVGFAVKVRVYPAKDHAEIAGAFRRAGKEADIVITYFSYWRDTEPMAAAIAANPGTLYISPYVQVGKKPTNESLQSKGRHPAGGGLRNFVTALPLCRHRPGGKLMTPLHRDAKDSETVNFIAPSSYASSRGETCPSAGVTAVVAAYIAAASPEKVPAEKIVEVMLRSTSIPEARMLKLSDFDTRSVENLRASFSALTQPDSVGIRRLEAEGVLDLWKVYQDIVNQKQE